MNWTKNLPQGIKLSDLSLDECRNFKQFFAEINNIVGPPGFKSARLFLYNMLVYTMCCIQENKFPTLNKCWEQLCPIFATPEYDNEWLVYCWIMCDLPLETGSDKALLDHYIEFMLANSTLSKAKTENLKQFYTAMKSSRLGLYQVISSTSGTTKYQELFTGNIINTIRSVPYYEIGEIFVTRIISYLDASFTVHDSPSYPPEYKDILEDMVSNKLFYISETDDEAQDYEKFMKLAGPYWMSCTHQNQAVEIFNPNHYLTYLTSTKEHVV